MLHAIPYSSITFYLMHTVVIVNVILMSVILPLMIVMTYQVPLHESGF